MKNKWNIFRLIGFLIMTAGLVMIVIEALNLDFEGASMLLSSIIKVGLGIFVFGLIWYGISKGESRKYCDKCGAKLYGCEYEYQEIRHDYDEQAHALKCMYRFMTICPNCGNQKVFIKTFTLHRNSDNLQYTIDKFCREKFGH